MNSKKADEFYKECLLYLNKIKIPYLVGGTFALNAYTGMNRPTKDLDIFSRPGDYPKIVGAFNDKGFKTVITDERWLAKISRGRYFVDVIFNAGNSITPVRDDWFKETRTASIFGVEVSVLPATELFWSKMFVAERLKYDGNDIAHLILRAGKEINWKKLLSYADQYWELLLVHILNFRFIYPSEREIIPHWLLEELTTRLNSQKSLPASKTMVCRGRLFSRLDYAVDIKEWGFADIIGAQNEKYDNPVNPKK